MPEKYILLSFRFTHIKSRHVCASCLQRNVTRPAPARATLTHKESEKKSRLKREQNRTYTPTRYL